MECEGSITEDMEPRRVAKRSDAPFSHIDSSIYLKVITTANSYPYHDFQRFRSRVQLFCNSTYFTSNQQGQERGIRGKGIVHIV